MKKSVVYYHPREVKAQPDRGSDLRVVKMLDAFQKLDYEVINITGNARERHRKIRDLKLRVSEGLKVEYAYGESTNAPILFADKRIIPSNFFRDYLFFSWLRDLDIPFGIFYRDVYWRFDFFREQLSWPFNIIFKPLYYLDWYMYDRFCTKFFLPSESMNRHLPRPRPDKTYHPLPPGFDSNINPHADYNIFSTGPLKLLYVGGIEPTVYDISPLFRIVSNRTDLQLKICCLAEQWDTHKVFYEPYLSKNIQVIHANNSELEPYYHEADLFMIITSHSDYRDFAMPVKLFEAIGYAVPIISTNQFEVANYILSADIGWVLNDSEELDQLLDSISKDKSMLAAKHSKLLAYRHLCTWESRARTADICLKGNSE